MEETVNFSCRNEWVSESEVNCYLIEDGADELIYRADLNKTLVPNENEQYALFLYMDDDGEKTWLMGVTIKYRIYYLSSTSGSILRLKDTFATLPTLLWDHGLLFNNSLIDTKYPIFRLMQQYSLNAEKETILNEVLNDIRKCESPTGVGLLLVEAGIPVCFGNLNVVVSIGDIVRRVFNMRVQIDKPKDACESDAYVVNGIRLIKAGKYYVIDTSTPPNMSEHTFRL